MRYCKAGLALMLSVIGCPMALAASPAEHAARMEQLCVSKRPASISYEKCLMDQAAVCERTNSVLRRVQGATVDCSAVLGLVVKDEAMAAAKQGITLKRTQASASTALQPDAPASGWLPNQTPSPGTFAIDNILSYLPTPDPTSERQCVELMRQQKAELQTAMRDSRGQIAFSNRWAVKGAYRDHLAKNSEIYRYVQAYAPTCLKSDLLVLQVWMEAIGQINAMPYTESHLQRSSVRFKQARSALQDAVNAQTKHDLDARQAVFDQRKKTAIERGAAHLSGVYLGAPVQASIPPCKQDEIAPALTCWTGRAGGQNEVILFNDAERPDYLEDLDPTHITPGHLPQGLCDFDDDDCIEAESIPPKLGRGRIVAFDTVDTNVERIRFRIVNDAGAVANVSEVLSKRLGVKAEVSRKSPTVVTSTWRSNDATATLICDARGCLVNLQSSTFETAQQRRRASETRPL